MLTRSELWHYYVKIIALGGAFRYYFIVFCAFPRICYRLATLRHARIRPIPANFDSWRGLRRRELIYCTFDSWPLILAAWRAKRFVPAAMVYANEVEPYESWQAYQMSLMNFAAPKRTKREWLKEYGSKLIFSLALWTAYLCVAGFANAGANVCVAAPACAFIGAFIGEFYWDRRRLKEDAQRVLNVTLRRT